MYIHTVWATRKDGNTEPELLTAWDEYSVEANPEGFEKDWRDNIKSWGDDFETHRHIQIEVPDSAVRRAFTPLLVRTTLG